MYSVVVCKFVVLLLLLCLCNKKDLFFFCMLVFSIRVLLYVFFHFYYFFIFIFLFFIIYYIYYKFHFFFITSYALSVIVVVGCCRCVYSNNISTCARCSYCCWILSLQVSIFFILFFLTTCSQLKISTYFLCWYVAVVVVAMFSLICLKNIIFIFRLHLEK